MLLLHDIAHCRLRLRRPGRPVDQQRRQEGQEEEYFQAQMIVVAVVLAARYSAVPVVLALLLLGESMTRTQLLGLLCAAAAIASLSLT